ncbi:MAG TPA: hypothetical protein VLA24_14540, partial [Pseudomonadales bacterium]|nr:hypothetical protein [Pseudomonadales bacterium]
DESASGRAYGQIDGLAFGQSTDMTRISDTLLSQTQTQIADIIVAETSIAPGSQITQIELNGYQALLPKASFTSAEQCVGHTFAASGMASLLHGLLNISQRAISDHGSTLTTNKALIANVSENQASQLLLSQTPIELQALRERLGTELKSAAKHQLIKTVTLGGRDIYQHIVDTPLAALPTIKSKMAQGTASSITTSVLRLCHRQRPMLASDNPILTKDTAQTNSRPTNVLGNLNSMTTKSPLNASSINASNHDLAAFQRNQQLTQAAHLAFLKSRSAGMKVADALLKQQLAQALGHSPATTPTPQSAAAQSTQPTQVETLKPDHANVPPYIAPTPALKPC